MHYYAVKLQAFFKIYLRVSVNSLAKQLQEERKKNSPHFTQVLVSLLLGFTAGCMFYVPKNIQKHAKADTFLHTARNNCSAQTHCWTFFTNTLSNLWYQSEKEEIISCHFTPVFAAASETKQIQLVTNCLTRLLGFFS